MGKVFIEKMLRLTEVGKIYLLMRPKKGKNPKDRLVDMFANPVSPNYIHVLSIHNTNFP